MVLAMLLGVVVLFMPHDLTGFMPHVRLRATVCLAMVGHRLVGKHCNACGAYSHADSVVEVNERLRRLSASPFLSSM